MGKDKKQTVKQKLDPKSQGHVDRMRAQATAGADVALGQPGSFFAGPADISQILGNAQQFLNPYMEQVIGGLGQEYDQLRGQATRASNVASTAAGSFGGSRHGVMEGTAHGELGRAQMSQVGGLLSNQFNQALQQGLGYTEYERSLRERQMQEPLFRHQAAQGFYSGGLGPVSQQTTHIQKGDLFKDIVGAGMMVGGAMTGNPGMAMGGAQSFAGGGMGPMPEFNPPTNLWGAGSYGMQPGQGSYGVSPGRGTGGNLWGSGNYNPMGSFGR
jgi:hypothetical protein